MSHRHRFEEVDSDEELDTPTTRPSYTYEDDSEIPVNRVREDSHRSSSRRHHNSSRRTGPTSLTDSFFDDDFFGRDSSFGFRSRRQPRASGGGSRSLMRSFFDDEFFDGGFGGMGSMMKDMHERMESLMNNASGHHSSSTGHHRGSGSSYYSSSRRIVSNNGVLEETAHEEDHTGRKRIRVRRQIGDKGSLVEKELTQDGTETTTKRLHNLRDEEEPDFEREWQRTTGSRSAFHGLGFDSDRGRNHHQRALRHHS